LSTQDSTGRVWYTANPAQKGLWVLDRVDQLRPTSLIPTIVEFTRPVDHALLGTSVQRVLMRHPALRSRFRLNIERKQVEYRTDGAPAGVGFIDAEAENWSADELDRLLDALCYTPFDLGEEPPVRAEVIRLDAARTLLVVTVHHIVCDGWSRTLIMAEIAKVYRALTAGTEPVLSSSPHPSEVITMLGPAEVEEHLPYVVDRLSGVPMEVEFPFARTADATSLAGATTAIAFDADLTESLLAAAREEGCTPFMIAVALLAGTLARLGKQRDFLFAFGWPGRDDPAVAEAIGMFMNTVVLRVSLGDTTTWRELLRNTRVAAMEAFVAAEVPLDAVTAGLRPNRDVIWPPLSSVLVNMAETPEDLHLAPGLVGRLRPLPALHMKYDFGLFVSLNHESGRERIELSIDYREALYDRDGVSEFRTDLRRSATHLAYSMEETVTEPITAKVDLSTPDARMLLVRSLWQEVLKIDTVDDDVSFFDVGGDSLLLIMLVERMTELSGLPIKTMDLFRAGTVRGHAALLEAPTGNGTAVAGDLTSRQRLLDAVRAGRQRQH
jgi:Condensation domain/Phosphopantetheine attachment site